MRFVAALTLVVAASATMDFRNLFNNASPHIRKPAEVHRAAAVAHVSAAGAKAFAVLDNVLAKKQTQTEPSPECQRFIQANQNNPNLQTCAEAFSGSGDTGAEAIVDMWCDPSNSCNKLIQNYMEACADAEMISQMDLLTPIICLEDDDGNKCFPFWESLGTLSDPPTQPELDAICVPCFWKMIDVIYGLIPEEDQQSFSFISSAMTFQCAKDGATGQYCQAYIAGIPNCDATPTIECFNSALDYACNSPCHGRFFALVLSIPNADPTEVANARAYLRYLCTKNSDDHYCASVFAEERYVASSSTTWGTCSAISFFANPFASSGGCAAEGCDAAVTDFFTRVGCCYSSALPVARAWATPSEAADLEIFHNRVSTGCSTTAPAACPARGGSMNGDQVLISPVPWGWVKDNMAEAVAAFKIDVALLTGLSDESITVTLTKGPNGGTTVTIRFYGAQDDQTTVVNADVVHQKSAKSISWPSANKASSEYQKAHLGSASSFAPQLLFVVAAIAAALAL